MPGPGDTASVPLIVITADDDHLSIINTLLREAGHAVHLGRASDAESLQEALATQVPELVLLFEGQTALDAGATAGLLAQCSLPPPLLVVGAEAGEAAIAAAIEAGARDLVTLANRERLRAVAIRELQAQRLRLALQGVLSSAREYKQELRKLMNGASEAIADVHEGIVVAANPAWVALLGLESDDQLVGQPFMDLFREQDQPGLKGALVACLRNKWQGGLLNVVARRADGGGLPLELRLETATLDGEPAVRVVVAADRSTARSPEAMLEQVVASDPSTGFLHRHQFLELAAQRLAAPLPAGVRCVVYLRPDNFARVNEDIGLLQSEALIMRLAELLREYLLPADLCGRLGGTIFAAVLERGTMGDVEAWASQVCKAVASRVFEIDRHSTSMTCTIGLCEAESSSDPLGRLLAEAEQCCRAGRSEGGNRVQLSAEGTQTLKLRQLDALWLPRLRNALLQNRLRLVHQPVVSLNDEQQGVLDTRIQLHEEDGTIVRPSEFLPAAERAGLMKNIDRWVIGASLSFCAARQPSMVFIRLSRDSLLDTTLPDWIRARAASTRARPGQVCLQVSEDIVSQHIRQARDLAEQLKARGILFAIDHVGIGRDSLQLLGHVPMQFLKIDGSLMQGLHQDRALQRKVGEIAQEARRLGISTVAERVESANAMAVLWQLGVGYVQGNFTQSQDVVLEDEPAAEKAAG